MGSIPRGLQTFIFFLSNLVEAIGFFNRLVFLNHINPYSMKKVVDLEDFKQAFINNNDFVYDKIILAAVELFILNCPDYKPPTTKKATKLDPSVKHPNFKGFVEAYKIYNETYLKRPMPKFTGKDGEALNLIIDEILRHTDNNYPRALEAWAFLLANVAKIKSEFIISQTMRLTSCQKYLSEIIRKLGHGQQTNTASSLGKYA